MAVSGNTLIGTRYRLDEKIGQGGMGTVYRGLDTQTGEMVAVKQLQPAAVASEPGVLERFSREGEALRQLNHPNIVKRLAAVEENDGHYLVMEYVAGGDLYSLLRREGKLPIQRILEIGLDLADALTRAHRLQIVHRDLKPANVLLAEDGTPRLTDFGVAFIASKERVTGTGVAVGTLDYLSPESLKSEVVDTRTDIWSFGVMLFEMLTGKRPFTNENISQTLMSIVADPVPDIEHLRPEAPIGLVDLICRMLEKDPHARIPTVRQVGLELETLLQGRSASSTRVPVLALDDKRFATPTPTHSHRNNLPAQTTPFVGRETELAELKRLMGASAVRLVTILAPGGMGKTRISLEVATQFVTSSHDSTSHEDHFHNGVFFVELAPLTAAENIPAAIAEAVGYQFLSDEREPKQQILDFLREKSILLLLDNFEHLIDGAAITSEILRAAPHVKIIATSRQRLNQSGETIFNLEGMDFPDWETPADALEYSAVKLFMQSAQRARPGFELQTEDLQYIARICRMVEGLPLGILLAASWLEMLSPAEIAEEMARSLDFLETQMSDIPERQRSIRAVFDYSWNLMNPEEQGAFMRLAVFRGGFTREAAQAVSGAALRTLMNLLNKSVLRRDPESGRYMVHELLRQYASDRLKDAGLADETHNAHSDYFAAFARKYETLLVGATQRSSYKDVETEMENIHDALHWAARHCRWDNIECSIQMLIIYYELVSRFTELAKLVTELEALMIASGLGEDSPLLWRIRVAKTYSLSRSGHFQEGYALGEQCSRFFEERNNPQQIALICASQCYASMMVGNYAEAKACGKHGFEISGQHGYHWEMLASAFNLGYVHFLAGEYDQAKSIYERILEKAEKHGSPPGMTAFACNNLGEILHALDDDHEAKPLFEKAYALFKEINNKYGMAFSLNNIGNVAHSAADYETARRYNQQALDLYREIGDRRGIADALNRLGGVSLSMGEYAQAQPYHEEALATYRATGDKRGMANSLVLMSNIPNAFGHYDEALRCVQESLQLRRELGNPAEIADSLWYMSLYTTFNGGPFEEAMAYLDEYAALFRQAGMYEPRDVIFRGIINLFYRHYADALQIFESLLSLVPEMEEMPWVLAQFYVSLGTAHYGLGHYPEAKSYLLKAVEAASRIHALDWALFAAIVSAAIIGKEGRTFEAVTWLAFGSEYPRYLAFMRQFAREFLAELLPELTPQNYAAAVSRSKSLDANTVIEQVLAVLQGRA